jgi:hypothetical protein
MTPHTHLRRTTTALAGAALLAGTLAGLPTSTSSAVVPSAAPRPAAPASQVVLDWERIVFRTVYAEGMTPIPTGVPILGFTSMAMYEAVRASLRHPRSSEKAAVAAAAHDVLVHYVPTSAPQLAANLLATLDAVRDGAGERNGVRLGKKAAAAMVADREGDGYGDPDVHYTKPPGVGVWQPTPPATDMLGAWLGSLRPLVLDRLVRVDGPDALDSEEYAADYREVKRLGSATSTARGRARTLTALFFNANSPTMFGDALVRHLQERPLGLRRTARLFAVMHGAMTDSIITCWQLKRDVGFWRPAQAIVGAADDGNPRTRPDAAWTSLIPSPPYADYVSGHACATSPAVETIRQFLGERTSLELVSVFAPRARTYPDLRSIEHQALNARIWSGLHFRDAMDDGYLIGHRTARRVLALVR